MIDLPSLVTARILDFLDIRSLMRLGLASKASHDLVNLYCMNHLTLDQIVVIYRAQLPEGEWFSPCKVYAASSLIAVFFSSTTGGCFATSTLPFGSIVHDLHLDDLKPLLRVEYQYNHSLPFPAGFLPVSASIFLVGIPCTRQEALVWLRSNVDGSCFSDEDSPVEQEDQNAIYLQLTDGTSLLPIAKPSHMELRKTICRTLGLPDVVSSFLSFQNKDGHCSTYVVNLLGIPALRQKCDETLKRILPLRLLHAAIKKHATT